MKEGLHGRLLDHHLDLSYPSGDVHEAGVALTYRLVGDVEVTALRIPGRRAHEKEATPRLDSLRSMSRRRASDGFVECLEAEGVRHVAISEELGAETVAT